jgi:hypothetical protein
MGISRVSTSLFLKVAMGAGRVRRQTGLVAFGLASLALLACAAPTRTVTVTQKDYKGRPGFETEFRNSVRQLRGQLRGCRTDLGCLTKSICNARFPAWPAGPAFVAVEYEDLSNMESILFDVYANGLVTTILYTKRTDWQSTELINAACTR